MAKRKASKRKPTAGKAKRARRHERLPKSLTSEQILAAADASASEVQSRLELRQFKVERTPVDFEPPAEVQTFLDALYQEPRLLLPKGVSAWDNTALACRIVQALWDAYRQGCRQGYIEGRVVEVTARDYRTIRKTKKTRAKLVPYDGGKISMDERDTQIFFELSSMRREHGSDAGDELMGRRACLDGRQVRNIFFEQTVLRERAALIQQGFGEADAAERVLQKHGLDKLGKSRRRKVLAILAKAPQRSLPEVQ
jgi:hypothetical protein